MLRNTPLLAVALVLAIAPGCIDLDALLAECTSDRDCDDDEECNDDGECEELECTDDDDCDAGEECRRDECRRIDCVGDEECGEGAFCDLADGKCREIPGGEGEGEGEGEGGEGEGEGPGEGEGEGGEGEGEGDPCGGVPETGRCVGDLVEFCVDGSSVETFDCNSAPFPAGQTDCVPFDGFVECAVRSGGSCLLNDGTSVALCQGAGAGCRLDDLDDGACATGVGACVASDAGTCDGNRFIVDCIAPEIGAGQPLFMDCGALGGQCESFGCLFGPGDLCVPELSQCGDGFESVACPSSGFCPEDEPPPGEFTHETGLGGTFVNDRPSDITSLQGAIDACNAHFNTTTCAAACTDSECFTVTRNGLCECTEELVWHYGTDFCFGGGNAGEVDGADCSGTLVGNWN